MKSIMNVKYICLFVWEVNPFNTISCGQTHIADTLHQNKVEEEQIRLEDVFIWKFLEITVSFCLL